LGVEDCRAGFLRRKKGNDAQQTFRWERENVSERTQDGEASKRATNVNSGFAGRSGEASMTPKVSESASDEAR